MVVVAVQVSVAKEVVVQVQLDVPEAAERGQGQGHIAPRAQSLLPSWGSWPCGRRRNGRG